MKLLIHGRVQGVGFRYSVLRFVNESSLSLSGYVQNLPNGSVEVVAQGPLEALQMLLTFAKKGPPSAFVRKVEEHFEDVVQELPAFHIKR